MVYNVDVVFSLENTKKHVISISLVTQQLRAKSIDLDYDHIYSIALCILVNNQTTPNMYNEGFLAYKKHVLLFMKRV